MASVRDAGGRGEGRGGAGRARSRRRPLFTRLRTGARRNASHPEGLRLRGRPGGRRASLRPSPAPAPEAPEESGACDFCAQGEVQVANNFRGGSAATSVGEKYVSSASVESLTLHGRGEVGENNLFLRLSWSHGPPGAAPKCRRLTPGGGEESGVQRSFVKKNGGRRGRRIASTAAEKETGDKTSAANGKPTMRRRSEQYPLSETLFGSPNSSERNREAERERSNCFCAVDLSFPSSPLPFPVSFLLLLPVSERRATSSSSHVFTCALSVGPDKLPSFSFSSPAPVHLPTIFFCGCCCCCSRCCCSSCPRIAR